MPVIPGYGTGGYQNIGNNILQLQEAAARNSVARQELRARQKARMLDAVMNMGNQLREDARYKQGMDYRKQMDAVAAHDKMREDRLQKERFDQEQSRLREAASADDARADAFLKIQQGIDARNAESSRLDMQDRQRGFLKEHGIRSFGPNGMAIPDPEFAFNQQVKKAQYDRMLAELNQTKAQTAQTEANTGLLTSKDKNLSELSDRDILAYRANRQKGDPIIKGLVENMGTAKTTDIPVIQKAISDRAAQINQEIDAEIQAIRQNPRSDATGIGSQPWEIGSATGFQQKPSDVTGASSDSNAKDQADFDEMTANLDKLLSPTRYWARLKGWARGDAPESLVQDYIDEVRQTKGADWAKQAEVYVRSKLEDSSTDRNKAKIDKIQRRIDKITNPPQLGLMGHANFYESIPEVRDALLKKLTEEMYALQPDRRR